MPVIARFKDEAALTDPEIYYPLTGTNLLDFICDTFEPNFDGLETKIFFNGVEIVCTSKMKPEEMELALNIFISKDDDIRIVNRPAIFTAVQWAYVAIAALAVATVLLMPSFNPGSAEQANTSPNNNLNAATNEFRPNQALPEVFGSPTCYPDFIQPSSYVYENNLKIQRELFCVSDGLYRVDVVKSGETNLDDIPNSNWQVFDTSVQIPPQDIRITARETNEITNQALPDPAGENYIYTVEDTPQGCDFLQQGNDVVITFFDSGFFETLSLGVGVYVSLDLKTAKQPSGQPLEIVQMLLGVYIISAIDSVTKKITISDATLLETDDIIPNRGFGTIQRTDSSGLSPTWIGWYSASGAENEEIRFHVVFPVGLRSGSGGSISITFEMQIRQVDESGNQIGPTISQTETVSGSTPDAQFRTYYFDALTKGRYQGRIRRVSDEYGGAAAERVVLEQLVGVEFQSNPDYGNCTLLYIERKAEDRIVSGSQSKINVSGMRILPTFNRVSGQLITNQLTATRDFADAVAYTLCVAAKKPQNTVDLDSLYAINDSLPPDLRYFDFTFDDKNVSLRERIDTICNVARVLNYNSYRNWAFTRIESKPTAVMIFNRRNTIGEASQSNPLWLPNDKNSITLSYVSQPDNIERVIYRSVENNQIVNTEGTYPREVKLVGCQSDAQAENRADYEIRQLLFQRSSVEFDAYYFGLDGKLGERVRWVDMNDQDVFDGEILHVIGNEYLTSEPIYFEAGKTYYVQCTDVNGDLSSLVQCYPLSYTEKGFSAALSGAYTADDGDFELGSKYVIAPDDELVGTDYILKSISPSGDNTVTVTLSEYNDKLFEAD